MAEQAERTYPALPSRRRKFLERGEFARSRDLTAAASFLLGVTALSLSVPAISRLVAVFLGAAELHNGTLEAARELWFVAAITLLIAVIACIGAVAGTMAQGAVFAPVRASFDPSRINPFEYLARLFSSEFLVQLGKAAFGLLAVGVTAWKTVAADGLFFRVEGVADGLAVLESSARRFLSWSCVLIALLGLFDYAYRRYQFEAKLRMTRQEFLDELKEEEGNPQLKRRRLRLMRQRARKIAGVAHAATASVVLVNPTHYAVALRYRRGFDRAPLCVAKGAGEAAARIIGIAKLAAIPVVSNPALCRALFQTVEVGQEVSSRFYRAVAEVLAVLIRAELKARAAHTAVG